MSMDRRLSGRRVRLVSMSDSWAKLTPGTLGTVYGTDDAGTIRVTWDNDSRLGLVDGDSYDILAEETP